MNEQQINDLLEAAKPDVIKALKEQMIGRISYEAVSRAQQEICDHTVAWVKQEILPEITKQLIESKDGLIAIGPKIAEGVVFEIAEALVGQVKEKMEKSWDRQKIFEAMFK